MKFSHQPTEIPASESNDRQRLRLPRIGLLLAIGCLGFLTTTAPARQPGTESGDAGLEPKVRLKIYIERDWTGVADPLELIVEATVEGQDWSGSQVTFPDLKSQTGVWEVLAIEDQRAVPVTPEQTRWTRSYRIESLFPGIHPIPELTVVVNQRNYVTEPLFIEVISSIDPQRDLSQIQPLKGPLPMTPGQNVGWGQPWIVGLATLLGLAGLAILTTSILNHRRARRSDPQAWALRQIGQLEAEIAQKRTAPERSMPQMADLLRAYIQRRWAIAANAQTTPEFLALMSDDFRLSPNQQQELRRFLQEVDRIKFASYPAETSSVRGALEQARKFILETTIQRD
jgi:hypothetical protein